MAHRVIASKGVPAAMSNRDQCSITGGFERHFHFRLLTGGEVDSSPFEDQSRRRLEGRDFSSLENFCPCFGLEGFEQPASDPGLEMNDPLVFPGDAEAQTAPPPKIDLFREDPECNRRLHCD